jgi:hypothetical protein
VPRRIVEWEPEALDSLLVLEGKAARRLLRLVSEFAEHPNAVDFERVPDSSYWYLYAPEVAGCRVLVSIDRYEDVTVVTVSRVHFVGAR